MIYYLLWFGLGLVAVAPLLCYANRLAFMATNQLLGQCLVVTALIYVVFSLLWGDVTWLLIEILGVPFYALFYYLGIKRSALWLSLGWFLHPLWDVALHLQGPGAHVVPGWYAMACVSFDVAVAIYIAYRFRLNLSPG